MIIGLYTDTHFSSSSNIITKQDGWSGRLSNLIKSIEWVNKIFAENNVDRIFCLGDLTDRPILNAEEISALGKCDFSKHEFVLGNHCRADKDGNLNTLSLFHKVYSSPSYVDDEKSIFVLPYNSNFYDLKSLETKPKIILSHNDIYDYNFGDYLSKEGYHIEDILSSCDLFINGHLHNGGWIIKDRIMNLGCLSGINFSSCGGEWNPSVAIIDTDTLSVKLIENPYAYKFRKKTFKNLLEMKTYLDTLDKGYVVQFKIPHRVLTESKTILDGYKENETVVAYRVISYADDKKELKKEIEKQELQEQQETVSPTVKLREYIINKKPEILDIKIFDKILDKVTV